MVKTPFITPKVDVKADFKSARGKEFQDFETTARRGADNFEKKERAMDAIDEWRKNEFKKFTTVTAHHLEPQALRSERSLQDEIAKVHQQEFQRKTYITDGYHKDRQKIRAEGDSLVKQFGSASTRNGKKGGKSR